MKGGKSWKNKVMAALCAVLMTAVAGCGALGQEVKTEESPTTTIAATMVSEGGVNEDNGEHQHPEAAPPVSSEEPIIEVSEDGHVKKMSPDGMGSVEYSLAPRKASYEDTLAAMQKRAKAYAAGDWDGSQTYDGDGDIVSEVDEDGVLSVSSSSANFKVVLGATLEDTTIEGLRTAYKAGTGWAEMRPDLGYVYVWDAEYSQRFCVNTETGWLSTIDYIRQTSDPCVTVFGAQVYDGSSFDTSRLAAMSRSGEWSKDRIIWCVENGMVARVTSHGIEISHRGSRFVSTGVFPAAGDDPHKPNCGWYDETRELTYVLREDGFSVYRADGERLAHFDDVAWAKNAWVAPSSSGALVYGGDGADAVYEYTAYCLEDGAFKVVVPDVEKISLRSRGSDGKTTVDVTRKNGVTIRYEDCFGVVRQ